VSLAGEILQQFEPQVEEVTLIPSDGGRFEVTVNDRLLYSKLKLGRHAEPGEVIDLVIKMVEG